MRHIKLFENFNDQDLPYEDWEMGVIKAWGHLLYIAFHHVPMELPEIKLVSMEKFKEEFRNYLLNSDDDEDLQDWMAEEPPTYSRGGEALYDRKRMDEVLSRIANKTRIKEPLIIYRYSRTEREGWNSFTTSQSIAYEGERRAYKLPEGTPVIFTGDLADKHEVIVNLTKEQGAQWRYIEA